MKIPKEYRLTRQEKLEIIKKWRNWGSNAGVGEINYVEDLVLQKVMPHLKDLPNEEMVEKAPLITDDDYDHPKYPNKTRLKVIPLWDVLYTHQEKEFRQVCEAQRDADHKYYHSQIEPSIQARIEKAVEEAKKEERER